MTQKTAEADWDGDANDVGSVDCEAYFRSDLLAGEAQVEKVLDARCKRLRVVLGN